MLSANDKPANGLSPLVFSHLSKPTPKTDYRMPLNGRLSVEMQPLQHIWIVTGPAGSGKTTVAQKLQAELGLPYLEGDDFHTPANKEKMGNGIPLSDADRWDWLISLRDAAVNILSPPDSDNTPAPSGVVMSCSALKLKYRDVIRIAAYDHPSIQIHFIYLKADEKVLMERVNERGGHYMKSNMIRSQFEALEDPTDEKDVLAVDVTTSPEEVHRRVSETVAKKLAEYN
ncbi:thermoresistant gluconokinase family protein [Talaromyces proteolyticus]|uniref:Gluconokinase n=1 Tax=Talaromyces proteolyticus TaxID=1131652 RepID=A0AAD4KS10_9EURO|nr:thermoresistant gluconokinase family protein [Talaromyces proteolyticus]KAH8697543.1 thermoresistant gluconokinase family protein [Talaromyces proteolyticus]